MLNNYIRYEYLFFLESNLCTIEHNHLNLFQGSEPSFAHDLVFHLFYHDLCCVFVWYNHFLISISQLILNPIYFLSY